MERLRILQAMLICGLLMMTAIPFSLVSGNPSGEVNNTAPNFTEGSCVVMGVNPTDVDNSGSDTIEFDATFYDANGDTDTEIDQALCTLTVYEGATNSDPEIIQWTFVWDSVPGGTEWVLDPTGSAGDGYVFIADTAADTDPGIIWTIPSSLTGSGTGVQHYVELYVQDDDGSSASDGEHFNVFSAVTIEGIYRDDGTSWDTSSPYDWDFIGDPGETVSSGDGTNEYWLVIKNTGSVDARSFIVTFVDSDFTSATTSETIAINDVIDWEYYESAQAPGGTDDPEDHGAGTPVSNDADGVWSEADFTTRDYYMWIRYSIDIPAVIGDADDYATTFTVADD